MTSALIIWKGLIVVTGSESPVVVVLSGSMEPGFKRVSPEQIALSLQVVYAFMIFTAGWFFTGCSAARAF